MEESFEIPSERFVFEEHILQIPDLTERIDRLETMVSSRLSFPIRPFLRLRLEHLKWQQKYSHDRYDFISWFFEMTEANPRNKTTYTPVYDHRVDIEGQGTEVFKINGKPTFYHSKQNNEETLIPVSIGRDHEAWLRIHRHPQITISPFDDLEVEYSFRTYFSLGNPGYDHFTKKLLRNYSFWSDLFDPSKDLDSHRTFYGKPGRVYYRTNDMLSHQLHECMLDNFLESGCLPYDSWGRKKLRLDGTIHLKPSNELLYQGDFECYNTSFPFFVQRTGSGDRTNASTPTSDISITPNSQ